jgi:nucleoside-diphosphate-sugar epimerase
VNANVPRAVAIDWAGTMHNLIAGASSGLGASLLRRFGGEVFHRTDEAGLTMARHHEPFDVIVHCAVDPAKTVTHDNIESYFRNNVDLTRSLLTIPHRRFIYLSSIDVYPKSLRRCGEEAVINAHDISGVYGVSKFYAEALVQRLATAPLIIRASALLGPGMRQNSLLRMLTIPGGSIGLSGASTFNYVRYEDVGRLIDAANAEGMSGIVNCASSSCVSLEEIRAHFGLDVRFGDFIYRTPDIDNEKAATLLPDLRRSSLENVRLFWEGDRANPA